MKKVIKATSRHLQSFQGAPTGSWAEVSIALGSRFSRIEDSIIIHHF